MNKFLIILFTLLISQSCSSYVRVAPEQKGINPIFKPYINSYRYIIGEDKYKKEFNNLSMNFAKLQDNTVGRCWWLLNGDLEIEIDPSWWYGNMFSPKSQEFLTYHELEHCIRKRMHTNKKDKIENILDFFEEIGYYMGFFSKPGYLKDGCPASLMHSHVLDYYCREKHYLYYIKELKKWKD